MRAVEEIVQNLVEAYRKYTELCRRPVPLHVPDDRREVYRAEALLALRTLVHLLNTLLRVDGAVTPHGLVGQGVLPVIRMVLPDGQARWPRIPGE